MENKRYEICDLGDGRKRHAVYDMPVIDPNDYWASVTNVPCPVCSAGMIRWNEAGYVPGSRICDRCGRFFQARGSVKDGARLMRDQRFDRPPGFVKQDFNSPLDQEEEEGNA